MLRGIPVQPESDRHLRPRRPEERRQGLLRLGQEQLRAAPRGRLDAARRRRVPRRADRRGQDGRPRRLLEGVRPDRPGAGVELRLRASRSACRRRISSPFGLAVRAEPGGPVRQHVHACRRRCRRRRPAGSRRRRRSRRASSRRASTTRSSRRRRTWSTSLVARELGGSFAIEGGYVGRFGRDLLIRRDLAMPLNLVDTKSGMDYFTAAQTLIRATQAAGIPAGRRRRLRGDCRTSRTGRTCSRARPAAASAATQAIARALQQRRAGLHHDAVASWTSSARRRAASTVRSRTSPTSTTRWRTQLARPVELPRDDHDAAQALQPGLPVRPELHAVGIEGHGIERGARQRLRQLRRRRLLRVPHQLLRSGGELRHLRLRRAAPGQRQLDLRPAVRPVAAASAPTSTGSSTS